RGGHVGLGVLLTVAALLSAMSAGRFVCPVGERTPCPVVAAWPVDSSLSVGTLTVDLTRSVLPVGEQVRVGVGVGEIRLNVPAGAQVRVAAGVGLGDIRVDEQTVDNGLGPQWSSESATDGALL